MMMGAGMVGMVAFWGILIWVAALAATRLPSGGAPQDSAHDILQQRFARGEIDREELESRSRALQGR